MLSFFPLDVLDAICDVIESVSEGFLTNSYGSLPLLNSPILSSSGQMIKININNEEAIIMYMVKIQIAF